MGTCHTKPAEKRAFIGDVGKELTRKHGKRQYYNIEQVRSAAQGFPLDFHCWAYAFYSPRSEFEAHHSSIGESCDYAAMKAEVMVDLAGTTTTSVADLGTY